MRKLLESKCSCSTIRQRLRAATIVLVAIFSALLSRCPSWGETCSCNQRHESAERQGETRMKFLSSPQESSVSEHAATEDNSDSVTQPGDLRRYSTRLQDWKNMEEKRAYFRDLWVGQETRISGAVDGDVWTCNAKLPDGSMRAWGAIRFYSSYGGESNCFVSPFWKMCGSTNARILWYTSAQCAPTGTWEFIFYKNNNVLFSEQFELLPQIPPYPQESVPLYAQKDYPNYPEDKYDHLEGETIASKGCALTSAAMVLSYHGFVVTPKELNDYLIQNDGYTKDGDIKWKKAIDGYSQGKVKFDEPVRKCLWEIPLPWVDNELENDICRYGPQIMRLKYEREDGSVGTHYVAATGRDKDKTTWLMNDSVDGTTGDITQWTKKSYRGYRRCIGPEFTYVDSQCGISITFHSPGELLITDPLGRKEGYDPATDVLYFDEIPHSGYVEAGLPTLPNDPPEPESRELSISIPVEGEYELEVIGTGEGNYDLEIYAWDREGDESSRIVEQVPISPNVVHTYVLSYSREAGSQIETSGAFDGKGQRPRDVNKFLSYSSPTQVTTELAQGETTFDVFVLYDPTIIPQSFEAELNRQDITSLFSPSPGGAESVRLNLSKGRNTLILSVDGSLASGRQATDRDRLVFIVP